MDNYVHAPHSIHKWQMLYKKIQINKLNLGSVKEITAQKKKQAAFWQLEQAYC